MPCGADDEEWVNVDQHYGMLKLRTPKKL